MTAKSLGERGNRPYPYKLRYLAKNYQNSTYINLFTVICGLVSHDKYSDIYFDIKQH